MMRYYECLDCAEVTAVKEWPATRYEPADSTWGDGCAYCGGELSDEPVDAEDFAPEPDYEPDPYYDDPPEGWEPQ